MLFNFLHHLFQTKVDCSAVSLDGYSPQNLVSPSRRERNQGFMAAHFIKPPVYVLLQFAFPIRVQSLVIKPKVGSQISTGLDVLVAGVRLEGEMSDIPSEATRKKARRERARTTCSPPQHCKQARANATKNDLSTKNGTGVDKQELKRRRVDSNKTIIDNLKDIHPNPAIPIHNYSTSITTDSFKNDHRNQFTLVSRLSEQQGSILRIVNRRYKESQMPHVQEDIVEWDFFQAHVLSCVTHLVICINRIKGGCVPALGRLEVWGQPSGSCNQTIQNYAARIQDQIMGEDLTALPESGTKVELNLTQTTGEDNTVDDNGIPSDFIDPITYKLMTIPMILPSGLNIDMTTLEKHTEAERLWGRLPSDPFTGVVFSGSMKPLPNSALKVRIDRYILSSGIDASNYGRTIGRTSSHNQAMELKRCLRQASNGDKTEVKGIPSSESTSSMKNMTNENGQGVSNSTNMELQNGVPQNHEEKISKSLDSALMKTLQGATFTRKPGRPSPVNLSTSSLLKDNDATSESSRSTASSSVLGITQELNCCAECKVSLNTAFRLPCHHIMCRKCLLLKTSSNKKATCSLCNKCFVHKEVIKVHTV